MSTVYWPAVSPHVTEEAGTRGGTHTGIDLAAKLNDPVLAAFDGTVVYVGGDGASGRIWLGDRWLYPNGQGKTVDIRRADGLISRVGHLNGYNVKNGQTVKAGAVIGFAGTTGYSTGVHIHWETRWDRVWVGGRWVNPRSFSPQVFKKTQKPIQRSKHMATVYHKQDSNPRLWALAGDGQGDAAWLETSQQSLATAWRKAHHGYSDGYQGAIDLSPGTWDSFKAKYLSGGSSVGGGASPAAIAKAVNDDAAKRMAQ